MPLDAAAVARIKDAMHALAIAMLEVVERPSVDRLHDGIRVVLAGPPNSGKSTLLNLLVEREAAIVSPIAARRATGSRPACCAAGWPMC